MQTVVAEQRQESVGEHKPSRITAIDIRIGLNMLGEHGRILLAQYIKAKRQHVVDEGETYQWQSKSSVPTRRKITI